MAGLITNKRVSNNVIASRLISSFRSNEGVLESAVISLTGGVADKSVVVANGICVAGIETEECIVGTSNGRRLIVDAASKTEKECSLTSVGKDRRAGHLI